MATFLLRENVSEAGGAIEASLLATFPGLIEVASLKQVLDREAVRDGSAIVLVLPPDGNSNYSSGCSPWRKKRATTFL